MGSKSLRRFLKQAFSEKATLKPSSFPGVVAFFLSKFEKIFISFIVYSRLIDENLKISGIDTGDIRKFIEELAAKGKIKSSHQDGSKQNLLKRKHPLALKK
jgi:hypothetical protein